MTRIVKFECGCIGTVPDGHGDAYILETCDSGGVRTISRDMSGKQYEPHDYTQTLIEHALSHEKMVLLRQALSAFGVPMYNETVWQQLTQLNSRVAELETGVKVAVNNPEDATGANLPEHLRTRNASRL